MEISRLKEFLATVASRHATFLKQNNEVNTARILLSNDDVQKFRQVLYSLPKDEYFKDIDPDSLWKGVQDLIRVSETTFYPGKHNINIPGDKVPIVPAVYDLLSTIFFSTDQPGRQRHFHDLTDLYYASLKENLRQYNLDISSSMSKTEYQTQIKQFTPFAKLEALRRYCAEEVVEQRRPQLKAAISEMHECLLSCQSVLREDCYKMAENYLSSREYLFKSFEVNKLEERKGLFGDYVKVKIVVEFNNEDKVLQLFGKAMPTTSESAKNMALSCFKKEEFYYETFIPLLRQLGCEDVTNFAPKCCFVRTNDIIVLEDLTIQDYINKDMMMTSGDYEWLLLATKRLAQLHACSIIFEEKSSEETGRAVRCDEEFGEYLEEELYIDRDTYSSIVNCAFRTVNYFLDKFSDIPKRMTLEEFKRRTAEGIDKLYEVVKKSDKIRNVINHGDTWCNNLLYKTNDRNEPIDCLIIDYQLTRYCPPVQDLLFLLYINTDKKTRQKYFDQLLDEYFKELKKILSRCDIDIEQVFTYQAFWDSCVDTKVPVLCATLIYVMTQTYPRDKFKLIQENEEKYKIFMNIDKTATLDELDDDCILWTKMRENIEDLYDIFENEIDKRS